MRVRGFALLCVAVFAAILCVSCGGGGGGSLPDPELCFFNGSPDSPDIDFYIDADLIAGPMAFLSKNGWNSTPNQERDIIAQESGTTNQIDAIFVNLQADNHYIVALLGLVNFGPEPEKRARIVFQPINRTAPSGNRSRLIIFHGFNREQGFQTPDIDFQNPGNNPQFFLRDIPPGSSGQLLIDSGIHNFEARRAGTEQVYATLTNFSFLAGHIYAVYVLGVENGIGNLTPQIWVVEVPVEA